MARHLPSLSIQNLSFLPVSVTFFFVLMAIFSVFLCGSHKAKKYLQRHKAEASVQLGDKNPVSKLQSNISSKALLMVKMISWKKVPDDDEDLDDDEAVWRRRIIMGERCRPLDFSGKILYDSQGNLLPDPSPQILKPR